MSETDRLRKAEIVDLKELIALLEEAARKSATPANVEAVKEAKRRLDDLEPQERSPTKAEAAYHLREVARLLDLDNEEVTQRAARGLRIIAEVIEGKRRFHKPPQLPLDVVQRLDLAARVVQHHSEQGKSLDEAVKVAMEAVGIQPANFEEEERIRSRILTTRKQLLKK